MVARLPFDSAHSGLWHCTPAAERLFPVIHSATSDNGPQNIPFWVEKWRYFECKGDNSWPRGMFNSAAVVYCTQVKASLVKMASVLI